jgi:N-acetylglucosaminyldiphosphoundecaprenol N-acetyl-beta-D-mannosaminyltransferase
MYILGARLDLVSREAVRAIIEEQLPRTAGGLCVITTVNAECIALASRDRGYREVIDAASLNVVDGAGVAWIAGLQGYKRVERIPGADLIYDLAGLCQRQGRRLFLLGAAPDVARIAGQRLQEVYPGLETAAYSPPLLAGDQLSPAEETALFHRLEASSTQAICVALGMPKQERWIHRYRPRLEGAGIRIAVGVGGALDYVAGTVPRAPSWMRERGMEWAYRLARQPRQRFRRQATRLPRFLVLAVVEALFWRLWGKGGAGQP